MEEMERDELFEDAARIIVREQNASTSLLQRKLKLGYNRAGRIMDSLIVARIVSGGIGSEREGGERRVLFVTEQELCAFLNIKYVGIDIKPQEQVVDAGVGKEKTKLLVYVKKNGNLYVPTFTIGVQTFHLEGDEDKVRAEWYCEQLRVAFGNLKK